MGDETTTSAGAAARKAADAAYEHVKAENDQIREAARLISGDLLDHWIECPLPPDANCEPCTQWFKARRLLIATGEDSTGGKRCHMGDIGLGYTLHDDGVHLSCRRCDWTESLGFDAGLFDALTVAATHAREV